MTHRWRGARGVPAIASLGAPVLPAAPPSRRPSVAELAERARELAERLHGLPARIGALGTGIARLRLTREEQERDVRRFEMLMQEAQSITEAMWPLWLAAVRLAEVAEGMAAKRTATGPRQHRFQD